jgi:hypothetical protein
LFVTRSCALLDAAPPETQLETRSWLVEPFLEYLGWNVRDGSCLLDRSVDGTQLEYVLDADSVPAVLVAVEPHRAPLSESRTAALLGAMAWTETDPAIYTNGREYLLFAGTTDVERLHCQLSTLPDHESVLEHYTREKASRRFGRDGRAAVARRLAIARPDLVDDVVARLLDEADYDGYAEEFEAATERLLDGLVISLTDQEYVIPGASSPVSLEYAEPSLSAADADSVDGIDGERGETRRSATGDKYRGSDEHGSPGVSDTDRCDERNARHGEYIVRFFADCGSVGLSVTLRRQRRWCAEPSSSSGGVSPRFRYRGARSRTRTPC